MNNFSLSGLPRDWFPVTPNDSTDNVKANPYDIPVGIRAGTGGDVVVTVSTGVDRTITLSDGETLPLYNFTRIKATNTTATDIEVAIS